MNNNQFYNGKEELIYKINKKITYLEINIVSHSRTYMKKSFKTLRRQRFLGKNTRSTNHKRK